MEEYDISKFRDERADSNLERRENGRDSPIAELEKSLGLISGLVADKGKGKIRDEPDLAQNLLNLNQAGSSKDLTQAVLDNGGDLVKGGGVSRRTSYLCREARRRQKSNKRSTEQRWY
ncbi:hypothetical protein COLO4_06887 [Corchorus olitorius]|uniref:Uncharacterized protein n=1 Tax=Corchorus olitorius TaxID=93759 RepID=A0A1R3KLN1_9ROSI|nr:hypothetical protein COLO4_06887 [Corchorus olitorius]